MSCLHYVNTELYFENINLKNIATQFGTPSYIYSSARVEANANYFNQAFQAIPHRVFYAVKANSNLAILNLLAKQNIGFDIVSMGELSRVEKVCGDVKNCIFSGAGKNILELQQAVMAGIFCIYVESEEELERIQTIGMTFDKKINIGLRINFNSHSNLQSHSGIYENKFGIPLQRILPLCQKIKSMECINLLGLGCHLGSQVVKTTPFVKILDQLLNLYHELNKLNISIDHLNIGGGLGIDYHQDDPPTLQEYADAICKKMKVYPLELILEPGRMIVGDAGVLLTRLEYIKKMPQKNFAIVDAGMNDLLRPTLYNAWHPIVPVDIHEKTKETYDIVGPLFESSDFLAKDRELAIVEDDLLAIDIVGAYGFVMSSNYNSRYRAAEVLVDGLETHLIRRREVFEDLINGETIPET